MLGLNILSATFLLKVRYSLTLPLAVSNCYQKVTGTKFNPFQMKVEEVLATKNNSSPPGGLIIVSLTFLIIVKHS